MDKIPLVITYTLSGTAGLAQEDAGETSSPPRDPAEGPQAPNAETTKGREDEIIRKLNGAAEKIAHDLEKELERTMRYPGLSVQAQIFFSRGSISLVGSSVTLIAWVGASALKTVKETFEKEFAKLIEVGTQRVIRAALSRAGQVVTLVDLSAYPDVHSDTGSPVDSEPAAGVTDSRLPAALGTQLPWWAIAQIVLLDLVLILQLALIFSAWMQP